QERRAADELLPDEHVPAGRDAGARGERELQRERRGVAQGLLQAPPLEIHRVGAVAVELDPLLAAIRPRGVGQELVDHDPGVPGGDPDPAPPHGSSPAARETRRRGIVARPPATVPTGPATGPRRSGGDPSRSRRPRGWPRTSRARVSGPATGP